MAAWMNHKLESRLPRKVSTTSDMQMISLLMAESEEELKSLLMRVKAESEKADLKPNIQKTKIMTSSPIISWGENGSSDRAYFLQLQNHCGQWLQPWNEKTLAPWKKNYNKPRHCITMQRHHFANKSLYSQSYDSHVWMWKLDHEEMSPEELMLSNCDAREDSWESLGLQGDQTSQS